MEQESLPKIIGYIELKDSQKMNLSNKHTQKSMQKEYGNEEAWAKATLTDLQSTANFFNMPIILSKGFIKKLDALSLNSSPVCEGMYIKPDFSSFEGFSEEMKRAILSGTFEDLE